MAFSKLAPSNVAVPSVTLVTCIPQGSRCPPELPALSYLKLLPSLLSGGDVQSSSWSASRLG